MRMTGLKFKVFEFQLSCGLAFSLIVLPLMYIVNRFPLQSQHICINITIETVN